MRLTPRHALAFLPVNCLKEKATERMHQMKLYNHVNERLMLLAAKPLMVDVRPFVEYWVTENLVSFSNERFLK